MSVEGRHPFENRSSDHGAPAVAARGPVADTVKSLRAKARQALSSGKLPNRQPGRTWGGTGSGIPCTVCGSPVAPDQFGMEVEFDGEATRNHFLHDGCFAAWALERQNFVSNNGAITGEG